MMEMSSLPPNWKIDVFNSIIRNIVDNRGKTPPICDEGIELLEVNSITKNRVEPDYSKVSKFVNEATYLSWFRGHPTENDILIPTVGTIGVAALVKNQRGTIAQNIVAIQISKEHDPHYWYYYVCSEKFLSDVMRVLMVAIQPSLKVPHMRNFVVQVPPLPQQQKIAKILTTVDNLIEKTQALIDKYTAIKQGMMADLFTRGIDLSGTPATNPNHRQLRPPYELAPELYKQTELGWVPKGWEVVSIKQVAEVKGGKRLPAGAPFAGESTPFPYLRVTDMVNGWIDDSNLEFVTPEIEKNITRYKIYKDDIYVTIAGTLGLFGRIPNYLDGSQLTENAARITSFDLGSYNADYFCNYLRSNLLEPQLFKSIGVGAGVPKLALYQIEQFKVAFPSKTEQDAIMQRIDAASSNIKSESNALLKFREMKKGLMQDLLTGKVKLKD